VTPAVFYNGSPVKRPETLRCQTGRFYDQKKVRNDEATEKKEYLSLTKDSNGF
jgi:hypothetical protein